MSAALVAGGILVSLLKAVEPNSPTRRWPRDAQTKKNKELPPRMALPASELEGKIMAMLRGLKECAKLKGVGFVHVGSFGQDPNWFAQPLPSRISDACRRAFVTAFAKVRKEFDLLFPRRLDTERTSPTPNNGGSRPSL